MSASKKSMTDSGRSTSDRSGWVAYMKRRAGSWITSAEQLAERVGITRECVTHQLITKCHLSSELFTLLSRGASSRQTDRNHKLDPTHGGVFLARPAFHPGAH